MAQRDPELVAYLELTAECRELLAELDSPAFQTGTPEGLARYEEMRAGLRSVLEGQEPSYTMCLNMIQAMRTTSAILGERPETPRSAVLSNRAARRHAGRASRKGRV